MDKTELYQERVCAGNGRRV